jgi:hypothetical protein
MFTAEGGCAELDAKQKVDGNFCPTAVGSRSLPIPKMFIVLQQQTRTARNWLTSWQQTLFAHP